jgi:hypothetical protein
LTQPAVSNYQIPGTAGRPSLIAVGRSGRYVRVQLARSNYLSIAELRKEAQGFIILNPQSSIPRRPACSDIYGGDNRASASA